ncbi:hypothetical protein GCM10010505_42030 [Kitasatospora aburaviensis]
MWRTGTVNDHIQKEQKALDAMTRKHGHSNISGLGKPTKRLPGNHHLWDNQEANHAMHNLANLRHVRSMGYSKRDIRVARTYFRAVYWVKARGTTNPSAKPRADLLHYYVKNWRKARP